MRLFSAATVDRPELLDELERIRNRIDLGFRPVERDMMHVTFQFFKAASSEDLEELEKALQSVDTDGFRSEVRSLGSFPSEDHIRVLWAGTGGSGFRQLHEQIGDHGIEPSGNHDFRPHITLLRVNNITRKQKRKVQKSLREYSDHLFGEMEVRNVKIFRSERTGNGTEYTELARKKL
ncbi:MAG: RNA 2',3'-cyclic phosphodiesterase [Candidatus Nanohaloarchaea archaeon]